MALMDELWRECAAWLTRCGIIPADHIANQPESEIKTLAAILRDGVLLCNLLNFLDPQSFDMRDFNRKPQMAHFLCVQNIKLFLEICKSSFGLKDSDLFEPTMLYDLSNFHRVLVTLSKLSQCRKAQTLTNIPGFNFEVSQTDKSSSDEDIYKDLHVATVNHMTCAGHDEHDSKVEEVYQDLCSIQITRNQHSSIISYEQRDFVIKELVDTETNYLEALMALKFKFMQPLERVLPKDVIRVIFPCIRELCDIHETFLSKLSEATAPDAKIKLSSVFLEFREPFLIYGDYCSSMTNATDMLRDVCKKSSNIEQVVNQCQKEHSGGRLQLRDILSVPMQRILKYHLLLDKLVQETNPSHEDFRGLERAKEAMVDVAQYSNEVKRDSEHLVVIQKVKESILDLNLPSGNNLEQYGRLLLDGELNIKAHEDQKTKHRYAFVFEKVMILVKNSNTKIGEGQYVFREAHNLQDYRVEICHSRRTLGRDGRLKYSLLLARKTQSTAFTLYMKTEEERDKWKRAFDVAMEMLDPIGCRNTDHMFYVCTFETPVICRHCSKFLKGKIHQGYRCKCCEIIVHKGCISSTGRCKQNQSPPPVCDRLLSEFNWFVGSMDRDAATHKLEKKKSGTYLLRVRPQGASNSYETIYALSLKTDSKVIKHMKIYKKQDNLMVLYYLSTRRHFKTIVELVSFYERNDLGENFAGLNQTLQWPYKEVIATALYDFSPTESNQLPLKQGCQVVIIGKEGDSKGWWRGKTLEKPGARFGAGPKVFIGVTFGYFLGKLSYQSKCADKIMRLPNSRLADIIRQRRQGNTAGVERLLPDQSLGAGSMLSPFGPTTPSDTITGDHYRRDFNLDVHVPQYAGLDDNERPTIDSSRQLDEDLQLPPSPPVSKSYEELRRQNREDYIRRQQAPYRPPPILEETPQIRREAERAARLAEEQQQPQMKNKYGDSWS